MTRANALVNGFFGSGEIAGIGRLSAMCQHDRLSSFGDRWSEVQQYAGRPARQGSEGCCYR